ncbi:MAG: hypothetical protein OQK05_06270 [Pseudopelagicola sp.]|nr:hypothetical protein [Pseudopelagicola sp.]
MIFWAGIVFLVLAALVVGLLLGRFLFERGANWCAGEMSKAEAPPRATPLPRLVRDFAKQNGAGRGPRVRRAELGQSVDMRLERRGAWEKLWGWQWICVREPGFVWKAGQQLWGPIAKILVLDAYVWGEGRLWVNLLGAIPVVRAKGDDINQGEAMRYLAELPWAPDAILENAALNWTEIDARHVRVSLGEMAVTFRFDRAGDIVEMTAKDRPVRDPDGEKRLRDWRGAFSDYRWIGGRRIPAKGEVGYDYPDGYEPYWRGEITGCHLRH